MAQKKPDPISDKARALNSEIAELEAEIKKLDTQLSRTSTPKYRSTALPQGAPVPRAAEKSAPAPPLQKTEPVFEEIKHGPLTAGAARVTPEIYNELGVRKYDLPALWNRICKHLHGPSASEPRLISLLAAGSVQGLQPLRKEKRIARNRVILLTAIFFAIMLGTLLLWLKHR